MKQIWNDLGIKYKIIFVAWLLGISGISYYLIFNFLDDIFFQWFIFMLCCCLALLIAVSKSFYRADVDRIVENMRKERIKERNETKERP